METEIAEFRLEVFNTPIDELPERLESLRKEILPDKNKGLLYYFTEGIDTIEVDDEHDLRNNSSYESFQLKYYKKLHKVVTLHHKFAKDGLLVGNDDDEESNHEEFNKKFSQLFETLFYWEQMIRSCWRVKVTSDEEAYESSMNTDIGLFRFKRIDPSDNTPYQNLILYLCTVLAEKGYRRQGDQCMQRIYTEEGYDTHAWKPISTIEQFVYKATNKDDNYQQWHNATNPPSNASKAIEHLEKMNDMHFIDVVKDRKLFSFPNGLYETGIFNKESNRWEDHWYPHSDGSALKVNPARSACNYFEIPFDDYEDLNDWRDIPTPHFQSILDYQEFESEVCDWMYVFVIGRMLYEVGELDSWQVVPFLKGRAGTGKSTILNYITKSLYHTLDVGVLANNSEKVFGLSAIKDKFIFIAPEVKGNIGLEQTDFQTLVSGEDMSIPEKFKTAKAVTWKIPGAFAGNEPMDYKDNQGSVSRRLVLWEFCKTIKKDDSDPELPKKLSFELPALLVKGNRAYLEMVNKYGKKGIWNILPEYFQQTKKDMAEQTNALQHFLGTSKVEFGEDLYILQSHFTRAYNLHVQENNLTKARWNKDYYSGPFESKRIEIVKNETRLDPITQKEKKGTWLTGVDLVREEAAGDEL